MNNLPPIAHFYLIWELLIFPSWQLDDRFGVMYSALSPYHFSSSSILQELTAALPSLDTAPPAITAKL